MLASNLPCLTDSDLDDDLAGDLDEEVSLGSLDEDFGDELGEEGGAFMDSIGEDDEEDSDEMEVPHTRPGSKKRNASEDLDFSDSLGSKPGKERRKQPCWHLLKSLCICWMKMLVLSLTTLA
ncbi:CCAAT/enhancer-binding protein zeta isoform X2 [Oncorhynchus clarkii lewisi]|uniref:CCAAT/enhancer-binding protein zeta isoform X2 n=1 Tax=Oncorhynchus clarkii lewisi TaxID=490388 RepID=UPI0039B98E04